MKKFLAIALVLIFAAVADAGPFRTIRERVRVREGLLHRVTHRHTVIRERAKPCRGRRVSHLRRSRRRSDLSGGGAIRAACSSEQEHPILNRKGDEGKRNSSKRNSVMATYCEPPDFVAPVPRVVS